MARRARKRGNAAMAVKVRRDLGHAIGSRRVGLVTDAMSKGVVDSAMTQPQRRAVRLQLEEHSAPRREGVKEQKEEDPMERDLAAFRQRVTQRPITEGQPLPDLGKSDNYAFRDGEGRPMPLAEAHVVLPEGIVS